MGFTRSPRLVCALLLLGSATFAPVAYAQQDPLTPETASRFLAQATLGSNWEEIQRTTDIGLDAWLEEQLQQPIGYHQPYIDALANQGVEVDETTRRAAWWKQVMEGPDPLRQRVALALSELFVVSDNVGAVGDNPVGLANSTTCCSTTRSGTTAICSGTSRCIPSWAFT